MGGRVSKPKKNTTITVSPQTVSQPTENLPENIESDPEGTVSPTSTNNTNRGLFRLKKSYKKTPNPENILAKIEAKVKLLFIFALNQTGY